MLLAIVGLVAQSVRELSLVANKVRPQVDSGTFLILKFFDFAVIRRAKGTVD